MLGGGAAAERVVGVAVGRVVVAAVGRVVVAAVERRGVVLGERAGTAVEDTTDKRAVLEDGTCAFGVERIVLGERVAVCVITGVVIKFRCRFCSPRAENGRV